MKTQKGFAHTYLIFGLILLIGFTLTATFLHNFGKRQSSSSSTEKVGEATPTPSTNTPEIKNKTYASLSSSGLTFDYPDTWSFDPPTEPPVSRGDKKAEMLALYSQKPTSVNGRPVIKTDNMCISFLEMRGAYPFGYIPLSNADHIADFVVGKNQVSLVENKTNLASGINAAMQLINQDSTSGHGVSYVALNDEYYLLATAMRNCFAAEHPEKKDMTKEIEQARAILKSVRIAN